MTIANKRMAAAAFSHQASTTAEYLAYTNMHTLPRQQEGLVVTEVIMLMCMVATHKPSLPGYYDTRQQGSRSVLAQVAVAQGAGRALRRNRRDACTAAYKSIMLHDEPLQNGPEQDKADYWVRVSQHLSFHDQAQRNAAVPYAIPDRWRMLSSKVRCNKG